MRRDEMLHVARAAASVAGVRRVLVVGSQAILGAFDESQLPSQALASIEADVVVIDDPTGQAGTKVDASIGYMSTFHTTNGYYADGVELTELVLPVGWEGRRLRLSTDGVVGESIDVYFLGVADLIAAKLGAGRPRTVGSRRRSRGTASPTDRRWCPWHVSATSQTP